MEPISITIGIIVIIAIVGAVAIVATFFVTRYMYKSKENRAAKRADAYKTQYEREMKVRQGLCQVAEEAGIDMQTLLSLSKKHQEKFQHAISHLVHSIHESTETTEKLNQVAHSIHSATEQATDQTEHLTLQLKQMQSELNDIYQKLKETQNALATREQELQETITKLQSLEHVMTDHHKSQVLMDEFLQQTASVCESINQPSSQSNADGSLQHLQEENRHLCSKIKQLDEIVLQLNTKLSQSNSMHQQSIHTIQDLLEKNKQMTQQIEDLTSGLENQKNAYQLRLFQK